MKTIGAIAVIAAVVGIFGYSAGWFNPDVELNVNPEVSAKVETFTQDTISTAQNHTNKAFDSLKDKITDKQEK